MDRTGDFIDLNDVILDLLKDLKNRDYNFIDSFLGEDYQENQDDFLEKMKNLEKFVSIFAARESNYNMYLYDEKGAPTDKLRFDALFDIVTRNSEDILEKFTKDQAETIAIANITRINKVENK